MASWSTRPETAFAEDRVAAFNQRPSHFDLLIKRFARSVAAPDRLPDPGDRQSSFRITARLRTSTRRRASISSPAFQASSPSPPQTPSSPGAELGRLDTFPGRQAWSVSPLHRQRQRPDHRRRSIRGGRPRARRALYTPALSAIRFNLEFKAKYQLTITALQPPKVAASPQLRESSSSSPTPPSATSEMDPRRL